MSDECEAVGVVAGLAAGMALTVLLAPWVVAALIIRRLDEYSQGYSFGRSTVEDVGVINWLLE